MFKQKKKDPKRNFKLVKSLVPSLNLLNKSQDYKKYASLVPEYLASSKAVSTNNQYFLAFKRFEQFCIENQVQAVPTNPDDLLVYYVKLSEESKSSSAVFQANSSIKFYNNLSFPQLSSPTEREDVKLIVEKIRRKWSKPVVKRNPSTVDVIKKLVDILLKGDHMKTKNFTVKVVTWRVVIKSIFKFTTFARFEEVVELKILSSFDILPSGDLEVTFLKGKNNQFFDARKVVISKLESFYDPVNLIRKYFKVLNYPPAVNGFFLPVVVPRKVTSKYSLLSAKVFVPDPSRSICYNTCRSDFKAALIQIGEDPKLFGEHSDKIGGLTAAANSEVLDAKDLRHHGRWKSANTYKMYHKKSLALRKKVTLNLGL